MVARILSQRPLVFSLAGEKMTAYHQKCLPPSLFKSGEQFPHQWRQGLTVDYDTLRAERTCTVCGAKTTLVKWVDDLSGDNRDACPGTRDLAWQTFPDSSAPLPRQPA